MLPSGNNARFNVFLCQLCKISAPGTRLWQERFSFIKSLSILSNRSKLSPFSPTSFYIHSILFYVSLGFPAIGGMVTAFLMLSDYRVCTRF